MDKNQTRCLRNWSDITDRYLLGTSSRAEIEDFWNCLDAVVSHFQKHFPGKNGTYLIDNLKGLLEKLFLSREIPDSFTERFKDLKYAIFSGNRETFSPEDLERLHLIFAEFKYGTSKMLPHMKIMNFSAIDDSGLDTAIVDLEEVTTHWTQKISPIQQNYKLEDLIRFWSELKDLIGIKAFRINEEKWQELLKIAKNVKSLILGAPGDQILQSDWPLLYQRSADAYIISLLYHYRLRGKVWTSPTNVSSLKKVSELIFRGVKESIRRHPDERISVEEFVDLAQIANAKKMMSPLRIRDASLRSAIVNLFRSILRDPETKVKPKETFLTVNGISFIETELGRWLAVQTALNQVFNGTDKISLKEFSEKFSDNEFGEILAKTPYLSTQDDEGQFLFSKELKTRNSVSLEAVSHLNWMTRVVRIIFHGYGNNSTTGVTENNFDLFYRDFRDFGVDIGFLDPKTFDSGVRTFLEANTFTESANGDSRINKFETVHELQILRSGGISANKIIEGVTQLCEKRQQKCVRGSGNDIQLSANVVEEYLYAKYHIIFSNLPSMVAEFDSLPESDRRQFFSLLLRESQKELVANTLTIAQIRYVVGLLYFAESIMLRHDSDLNNIIDANEVRAAFGVFQGFLERAIWKAKNQRLDPETVFVGFAYFLKNGESMARDGMLGKISELSSYAMMKWELKTNSYRLSRWQILRAMMLFRNFASGS